MWAAVGALVAAVQGETTPRLLTAEGFDRPGELLGRDFTVPRPIPVGGVLPAAVEPASRMLAATSYCPRDARRVHLPGANRRTADRAREVADRGAVSHRISIDTPSRR